MAHSKMFTLAFIFSADLSQILLVHKQKPDWQKGSLNGVGGKFEPGETAPQCISRETREETTLTISESDWISVGTIQQPQGPVEVFTTRYSGPLGDARRGHHEDIEWFSLTDLPNTIRPNLRFFIPLCLDKLTENTYETFVLTHN